jgi:uncharacterized OB-fold protein
VVRVADPSLYDFDDAGPMLLGSRCGVCGALDFPSLRWGCQRCGADDAAEPVRLPAVGIVRAAVTVPQPTGEACRIAELVLDAGPTLRCLVEASIVAGDRVVAEWAEGNPTKEGEPTVVPMFVRARAHDPQQT